MEQQDRRIDFNTRERIAVLETKIATLLTTTNDQTATLANIERTLAEAKGGWKILMLLGGGAGALGAFFAEWLHAGPK